MVEKADYLAYVRAWRGRKLRIDEMERQKNPAKCPNNILVERPRLEFN
jgi:hypothetical protein